MSFTSQVVERATSLLGAAPRAALCVGIDPHPADVAKFTNKPAPELSAEDLWAYSLDLVDATQTAACCYKPNEAFYEAFGYQGIEVLERVCQLLRRRNLPILLDAKRGDIASTAEAYATAVFDKMGADAVTLSPYMGTDSLRPFINRASLHGSKALFVLCKTSNPGSAELQDLLVQSPEQSVEPQPVYMRVAEMCARLNTELQTAGTTASADCSSVGIVVGATCQHAMKAIRAQHNDMWFLAPGVGAQGATMQDTLSAGAAVGELRLIIPVSRAVSRAENKQSAAEALLKDMMPQF